MKQCCTCKEAKELSEFYANKRTKGGLDNSCKSCHKERANAWYANNKDKVLETKAEWYRNNKEAKKKYNEEWRAANPDKAAASSASWCSANKDKVRAMSSKRRASKLQRTVVWADKERIQARYTLAKYLTELDGRQRHVDHIIPLRGELVSGLHVADNLQILYAEDNLSKSNNYEVI